MFNYTEPLRHEIVFVKLKHKTTFKIRTYSKGYVKPFCHCEQLQNSSMLIYIERLQHKIVFLSIMVKFTSFFLINV